MTNENTAKIPLNWNELRVLITGRKEKLEEYIKEDMEDIKDCDLTWLPASFDNIGIKLMTLSLFLGPSNYRHWFKELESDFEIHLKVLDNFPDETWRAAGHLKYITITKCLGGSLPDLAIEVEKKYLPLMKENARAMADKETLTFALATLDAGLYDHVPAFIGGGSLPASVKPGETFQFDAHKFIRYLAVAARNQMPAEEVKPAFLEFVQLYPLRRNTGSLSDIDLMYLAKIFYVHFEKAEVVSVGQKLYELVGDFADRNLPKITFE